MNRLKLLLGLTIPFAFLLSTEAQQKVYMTSGGEVIFSWGQLALKDQWITDNSSATNSPSIVKQPVRFTAFFHLGQFVNMDLNNTIGFYSGINLRNVGMISDETLPIQYGSDQFHDVKVIRRAYTLGIPLALKLGSFKDHFFIYGGAEIEWAFHYKEKYWLAHTRSGAKNKYTEWWPNQVEAFQPSAFVGFQFPGGINIKAKYYLDNFLNQDYRRNTSNTTTEVISDLTKYKESRLFFIALSWQFNTSKITQSYKSGEVASLR